MPGSGLGLRLNAGYDLGPEDLIDRPDTDTRSAAALNDYLWGGGPPAPTQIPYTWLKSPVRFRPDRIINSAAVSQTAGAPARITNETSVDTYGESAAPPITLSTICDADANNLATHLTAGYADPRMRCPQLTINLLMPRLTTADLWTLLGVTIGDRIEITGAPATWPEGSTSLVIEGIQHSIGIEERLVTWNTSSVIGVVPGTPGPWFRADTSRLDGTDKTPF